jgi:hypothetical protein
MSARTGWGCARLGLGARTVLFQANDDCKKLASAAVGPLHRDWGPCPFLSHPDTHTHTHTQRCLSTQAATCGSTQPPTLPLPPLPPATAQRLCHSARVAVRAFACTWGCGGRGRVPGAVRTLLGRLLAVALGSCGGTSGCTSSDGQGRRVGSTRTGGRERRGGQGGGSLLRRAPLCRVHVGMVRLPPRLALCQRPTVLAILVEHGRPPQHPPPAHAYGGAAHTYLGRHAAHWHVHTHTHTRTHTHAHGRADRR